MRALGQCPRQRRKTHLSKTPRSREFQRSHYGWVFGRSMLCPYNFVLGCSRKDNARQKMR
jgi:hypothetical protein